MGTVGEGKMLMNISLVLLVKKTRKRNWFLSLLNHRNVKINSN